MKRWHKRLAIAAAVTIGLVPAGASALDIFVPALLIPDICPGAIFGVGGCITWTHSTELVQVENLLGVIENLKASHNILTTISIVRGEIPAIEAAAAAAPPVHVADVAAATAVTQVPAVDAQITASGDAAAACTGALCVQQATAAQTTTIASEVAKANQLHEKDTAQMLNVETAFATDLNEEFGTGAHMPGELQ